MKTEASERCRSCGESCFRLYNVIRRGPAEEQLAKEVASHLALLEDRFRAQGLDAGRGARRCPPRVRRRRTGERTAARRALVRLARRCAGATCAMRCARSSTTPGFTLVAVLHARPRHRRGHHHLQRHPQRPARSVAVSRLRSPRERLGQGPADRARRAAVFAAGRIPRLPGRRSTPSRMSSARAGVGMLLSGPERSEFLRACG